MHFHLSEPHTSLRETVGFRGAQFEKQCKLFDTLFALLHELLYVAILAPELFFFLILTHPVYKMWILQEQNTLELWNKLYFEEEKTESIYHV